MNPHHFHNIINGSIGVIASAFSVITTFQTQLEWWARMTGSVLGILVAIITLFNLLSGKRVK
jgi:hypothetical protein